MTQTRTAALIVAAGRGTRFGADLPKQYVGLGETCAFRLTVERFLAHPNPLLRAHAVWTARRLGVDVPDDLAADPAVEVRDEFARA